MTKQGQKSGAANGPKPTEGDAAGDDVRALVAGLLQDVRAIDERNRQLMQRIMALQQSLDRGRLNWCERSR